MNRSPSRRATPPARTEQSLPQHFVGAGIITAIERQPRRNRFNIFVDGVFVLALGPETLAAAGLRTGNTLAPDRLPDLQAADQRRRALDAALRLLGARPRSQREIEEALLRRGLPADVIATAVERLRDLGYVDDAAFARAYVEGHSGATARGRRRLSGELRRKGVAAEVAGRAVAAQDDAAAARTAAAKKVRSLRGLAYPDFRNRLAGYLLRRGFDYDTIRPVIQEQWQVSGGAPAGDDDSLPETV